MRRRSMWIMLFWRCTRPLSWQLPKQRSSNRFWSMSFCLFKRRTRQILHVSLIHLYMYIYIYSRYSRNRFEWLKGSTLLFHSYQSNINHCRKIKAGGASSTRNIQPFGWWKSPGTSFKCMLGHWDHWDSNKKVMYVNSSFLWNFGYNKGLVTKFMLVFENKQPWILDGFPFLHLGVRWLPMQMMSLGSGKMVPGEMGKDRPWEFSKKPRRYTWSLRLNLKMRHWKRIFLLQVIIFSFQINFWRCKATLDLKN